MPPEFFEYCKIHTDAGRCPFQNQPRVSAPLAPKGVPLQKGLQRRPPLLYPPPVSWTVLEFFETTRSPGF